MVANGPSTSISTGLAYGGYRFGPSRGTDEPVAEIVPNTRPSSIEHAEDAAVGLRRLVSQNVLDGRGMRAALVAAGYGEPEAPVTRRPQHPGGLWRGEVDVLRLAARGLITQAIADRLYISPKTADHHIPHIYDQIGVSTRTAAALGAMQHAIVSLTRDCSRPPVL
jgi:DNA-binding CsgD family transcriptional regulator